MMQVPKLNTDFDAVQVQLSARDHWVMTTKGSNPIVAVQSWHYTDRKQALIFAEDLADDFNVQLDIFNGKD